MKAREGYLTLDDRMDKISIGNIIAVDTYSGLPSTGTVGRLYTVKIDETNQNKPTAYIYRSSDGFVRVGGTTVSKSLNNGKIYIDGTEVEVYKHPNNHSIDMITDSTSYVRMKVSERSKLSKVEEEANKYVHPENHSAEIITETNDKKFISQAEKDKLNGVDEGANKYVHPETHSADMIEETTERKFVTTDQSSRLVELTEIPITAIRNNQEIMRHDISEYDVVAFMVYDDQGKITDTVVTDSLQVESVKPPVNSLPSIDTYQIGDAFLNLADMQVYVRNDVGLEALSSMYQIKYIYNEQNLITRKEVTDYTSGDGEGATPSTPSTPSEGNLIVTIYDYFYDTNSNRIGQRKRQQG